MQTLNLFELSQHFSQTGPEWLKESGRQQSPQLTPAPPPSACGYYHPSMSLAIQHDESAVLAEEDEDSELDYGGLGKHTVAKLDDRAQYSRAQYSRGQTYSRAK